MATEDEKKLEMLEASLMLNRKDPHKWLWLGRQQRKMARLDDARTSYGRVLGIDAKFSDAHYELALVDALAGDEAAAEAGFARAIECNATHFGAHDELAKRRENARNWEAAAGHLEAMAVAKPEDVATSRRAARLLIRVGRFAAATIHLERAVAVAPNDVDVRGELARCRADQGEWQNTIDCLAGIPLDALAVDALLALGRAQEALAQPALAARCYEAVFAKDAEHIEAIVGLGRTCLVEQDFARARVMFERAVERQPESAEFHALHAEALQALGEYEAALGAATRGIGADPTSAASHEGAGLALNALRRFDEAVSAFGRAMRYDGGRLGSLLGLAEAHERLNQGERAVAALAEAIAIAPSDAALRERSANLLYRLGHTARALSTFREAVALDPNLGGAHRGIGRCAVDLERFPDAIDALRQAIELDAGDVAALRLLGTAERALGKSAEAAESFERATRVEPNDAKTWQDLGASLVEAGRLGPGLDALERSHALDPSDSTERLMASALMRSSRFEDVVPVLERIVKRAPDDAALWRELGRAERELGHREAARDALGKAARLRRTEASYFQEHGLVCLGIGEFDAAIESLERARQLDSSDVDTAVALGSAYNGKDRFADAVSVLEAAVAREPARGPALSALGRALAALGRLSDAKVRLQQAVSLADDDGATHHELGEVLVRLGEVEAAIAHFERAVLLTPEREAALRALARALGRVGRHQDALTRYRQLLRQHPDDGSALLELADTCERLGREEEALGYLEQAHALRADPGTLRRIGLLQAKLGRDRLAADTLGSVLGNDPLEVAAYGILATSLERLGDAEAAIDALSKAARLAEQAKSSEAPLCFRRLGLALAAVEREPSAIEALTRAIALGDPDVETRSRLGALHRDAGERALEEREFAVAVAHLERALESQFDAELCRKLAKAQLAVERSADAITLLQRGVAAFPKDARLASFLGRTLLERGDADGALAALRAALALEPHAYDELWLAAQALDRLGRRREAIELLVRAGERRPEAAEVAEQLGRHYYAEGRVQDALKAWEQVLALRPLDAQASYESGRCQRDLGQDELAAASFGRAFIQSPNDARVSYELGAARARLGQFEASIAPLESAIELDPDHEGAAPLLARSLARVDRDEDAARVFARCLEARFDVDLGLEHARCLLRIERFIELERAADLVLGTSPGHPEALQLRARALEAQGRNDEALKALRLAVSESHEPGARAELSSHLLGRAQAHTLAGDPEAAAGAYREALTLAPHDVGIHVNLARALRAAGQLQPALEAARAGIAVDAKSAELWLLSAELLVSGGVLDESIRAYRAALDLDSEQTVAWLGIAEVLEQKGEFQAADEALARASALPEPQQALRRRRAVLERLGRPADLAQVLLDLRALGDLDGSGERRLAELQHELGRPRDVVESAEAALRALTDDTRCLYLLGAARRALGEDALAVPPLERLVELSPDHHEAWALLARAQLACEAWERAVPCAERALGAFPDDVELWRGLGDALERLGRREEQSRALLRLVALAPSAELERKLGLLLDDLGAPEAETHLEAAAQQLPRDTEVANRLAALLLVRAEGLADAQGQEEAVALLQRAVPHARNDAALSYTAANQLRRLGRLDDALAVVGRVVELSPQDANALTLEGQLRFETGAPEGAVASFRRAVELEADRVPALHGMGQALLALSKPAEAELALRRAVTIRSRDKALWSLLTDALEGQGKRDEACESQRQVVRLEPGAADEQLRLAELSMSAGRFADSVEVLAALYDAKAPRADVALAYARSLVEVDRMRDAVDVAARAIEAGRPSLDQQGNLWQVRALALEELDEPDSAIEAHERAHELGRSESGERFGQLLRRRARELLASRPGSAAELFERALALGGRDAPTLVDLARARRAAGELRSALDAVRAALEVDPALPAARLLWPELEAALGRHDLAVPAFEQAIAEQPESAEAWLGLGLSKLALRDASGVAALERSAAIRPTREALAALVTHHRRERDDASTLSALDRLARLGPLSSAEAFELATLRIAHGRAGEALLLLDDALSSAPDDPDLLLAKGRAAAATDHPELARTAFERLLELVPAHDVANGLLGRVLGQLGDASGAAAALERQVALTPTTECLEELADALGRSGDEARRREILDRLARAFHEDPSGLVRVAETHRASGRLDEASAALERARQLAPEQASIQRELARLLLLRAQRAKQEAKPEQALALLGRVEEAEPEPAELRSVAALYAELGELGQARRAVETWLGVEPTNVEALTLAGELGERAGDVGQALQYFERALQLDSDRLPALRGAGFLLQSDGKPRAAAEKFVRALRLDPSARDIGVAAVACARAVSEDEVSERLLRELVRLLPKDASARRELAIVLARRALVAEGLEQVEVGLSIDPEDAAGYVAKANLLIQAGRPKDALAAAARALEISPGQSDALRALGLARAGSGETRDALEPLEAAYREQPSPELARRLATLHVQQGQEQSQAGAHDLAVGSLSRALELGDDAVATRIALGRSLLALGQSQKVLDTLEGQLSRAREALPGWLLLGEAYSRSGQWPRAAEAFAVSLELDSESFEAFLGAARTAVQLGSSDRAASYYERAIAVRPSDREGRREAVRHYEAVADADAVLRHLEALGDPATLEHDELKRMGILLSERQRDEQAERVLEQALERGLADVATLDALTLVKARREPKSAVELAARLVELDPSHLEGWVRLARGSSAASDTRTAERAYERAIALEPRKDLLAELATLQAASPEADGRIETLRRLVERYPEDAEHTATLGLELAKNARNDAIPVLRRALELQSSNPDVPKALYRLELDEVQKRCDAERLTEALEVALRADALLPEETEAKLRMAAIHERLDQTDRAIDVLRAVLALDASHPEALVRLGAIEIARGEFEAAIPRLGRAAELVPSDIESLRHLAEAEARLGRLAAAIAALERLLERAPSDLPAARTLIRHLLTTGAHDRALGLCQQALERAPGDVPLQIDLARSFHAGGRLDSAVETLQRVLRAEPDNLVAHQLLVDYLREQGDLERLSAALKDLFRLEKTREPLLELEQCAHKLDQPELLLWALRELTVLVPNDAMAFARLGEALGATGRVNEAIQQLERAVALDSKTPWLKEALVRVCWSAARQKRAEHDHRSALEYYEKAMRHSEDSPALAFEYAEALRRSKSPRAGEAMKDALRRAIANPSAGAVVLPELGAAFFEMQDYPAAVQAYHRVCQLRPQELELQRALISALLHAGRRAEAADWMRHALRLAPRDEALLYSLGLQCVALGRMNEVRDVWTMLSPLNPALAEQLWTASTARR